MIYLRSATIGDLDAVSKLLGEAWHATYDGIYGPERVAEITAQWHSPKALADNLSRPHSEFVLADSGDKLAGMAYASMVDRSVVALHQLYVRPGRQGQGAGSMLLEEMLSCFPDARTIRLEVEEANTAAIKFYRSHGFGQAGSTGNCGKPDSGIPALIFEKAL